MKHRAALAQFTAETFTDAGAELHISGHIIGTDRITEQSPFGNGSDERVGVSVLLRMASQLVSASADLFGDGRPYAAAALARQIVELQYLAWAFDTRDRDAERWLRSDRKERLSFFTPGKLRAASKGHFQGEDYTYHCELGGHPVPTGTVLLNGDPAIAQLLLSDTLGHCGGFWDHLVRWAAQEPPLRSAILRRSRAMSEHYSKWKHADPLTTIPPPPPPPP